jgi:CHAT domain-containing protein/Tfp pilus assembly protein PilF
VKPKRARLPKKQLPPDELFPQLAQLTDAAGWSKFIRHHPQLLEAAVVERLSAAVTERLRVNTAQALRMADAAVVLAAKVGNPESVALSLRTKANALWASGDNKSAVSFHEKAIQQFEGLGETHQVARTLSASLQPLILLGEYERALAAAERARQIFTAEGNQWRLARLEINVGNIYHRQDRFVEALACYQRALDLLPAEDTEGIVSALHNSAVCQISLNEFRQALANYQRARTLSEQHGMTLSVVQADYNIAYLYFFRGEYGHAIEMLRACRLSAKASGDAYHGALCNLDLAEIYLELNLSEEAGELAQEAHRGFLQLGMGYEAAKSLAFAAMAASQQGQAFHGLKLFAQTRASFVREKNQVWPSLIDLYQALVLYNEGRLFEARRLCAAALEFFASSRLPTKAVLCRLLLARVVLRTGDLATARRECARALEQVPVLEAPVLSYQAHFVMAEIQSAAGASDEAYCSYQYARQALETLRSSLRGEELKIAFLRNKLEVYERLVELCLRRDSGRAAAEEAFGYVEQAKSRALMELMLQPAHRSLEDEPGQSELVRSIRDLREELNWYYNLIQREELRPEERSPERIEKLERQARARESDLVRTLREASTSEAGQAGVLVPTHLPIEEIQAALPAESTLVEYFCVGDRVLAFVLGRENVEAVPVTLASRAGTLLRMLQFQLSKFRLGPDYVASFRDSLLRYTQGHLADLYQELLAPIRDRLAGRHLIFVPHGVLHHVPFHALFDGKQYLIDSFTVGFAPSSSVYALCHRRTPREAGGSLILGVPDPHAPSILEEVQSLAGLLPEPQLFLGAAASEDVLRKQGPQSRVVHIATHGFFRQDNPMFSGIRLGGSYLSLYDLYQFRLPVELVTLSGCATGLNVVAAGDELLGLARGLLHAGARSLLLTLWDVHDKSTAEFMTAFYRRWQAGGSKALALQGAMWELRERYPHPYQWAPFRLGGVE